MKMAEITDVGMLFVRCGNGGISHHPDETMTLEDADLAARAFEDFLVNFGQAGMTLPVAVIDRVKAFVEEQFLQETQFLAELVRVPSDNPPGDCDPHARRACELLTDLGFDVEVLIVPTDVTQANGMITATNLIVRQKFGAGGPTIALNAHGDVVPPGRGWTRDPYGAEIVDDPTHGPVMYGRGVAVSKSDFATYAWAMLALSELAADGVKLNGALELHLTYDEEVGGTIGPALAGRAEENASRIS